MQEQTDHLTIDVLTIFPSMLKGFLEESMLKRAVDRGAVAFNVVNLRDFTDERHKTTDDRPFGGGPGMVMKPEPIFRADNCPTRRFARGVDDATG